MDNKEYVCTLCPRKCNAVRRIETGDGFCRMGTGPRVARAALHYWEEPCISGEEGSGAIFFSGCTLRCVYCQNYEISKKNFGKTISINQLCDIYKRLEEQGANNINLVNPTHFVDAIIESFEIYKPSVPVVYNSGGYESVETLKRLDGLIDVYLPDLKYADDEKAKRYSYAPDYFEVATKAIVEMAKQTGPPKLDNRGIIKKGTIVRHLVLPENTKNSESVLRWLSDNLSGKVLISLMGQYTPFGNANQYKELNRKITRREYNKLQNLLFSLDIDGFVQDLSSAQSEYIPDFNLEGIS